MHCQNCNELNQSEFERRTCTFKNRRELLLFLSNTLLNIKCFNYQLCYCQKRKEYLVFKIKRTYTDYEYELYKNMFDLDVLSNCHSGLHPHLYQLFNTKKVCFTLSNENYYVWKDWFNRKNYRVSLSDAIKPKEEHDINKITNNDFKIELTTLNF